MCGDSAYCWDKIPLSRRTGGTSVPRRSSIAISPPSGIRKPATRLSSVVLPQPEGPRSVISSPRRTSKDTSSSAVVFPKRLVTRSSWTAMSSPFGRDAIVAEGAKGVRSARVLNVQHLCETEEYIGKSQQRGGDHDIHDRDRSHRGVCILAHVVVECDG